MVARLVIDVVHAGEHEQHGNPRAVEARVVARAPPARIGTDRQAALLEARTQPLLEALRAAHAAHHELIVAQAADHVQVHHRVDRLLLERGVLGPVAAAIEADLLGAEGHEEDAATVLRRLIGAVPIGHQLGHAQHGCRAARVVIGTRVELAAIARIGAVVAEAHVVVVAAHDDPFIRERAGTAQHAANVVGRDRSGGDLCLERDLHGILERHRRDRTLVGLLAPLRQRPRVRIGLLYQRIHRLDAQLYRGDREPIAETARGGRLEAAPGIARIRRRDHDHADCTTLGERLELRRCRAVLAPAPLAPAAHAFLVDRLIAEEDGDAALEVLALVLEARVASLARFDRVAGERQWRRHARAAARTKDHVVIAGLQHSIADGHRAVDHLRPCTRQFERLAVRGALALALLRWEARLEPGLAHPELHVVGRGGNAIGARRATLEVWIRERHHVLVPLLPDRTDRRELAGDVRVGPRVLRVVVVDVDRSLDDRALLALRLGILRQGKGGHGARGAQEHGDGRAHGEHRGGLPARGGVPRRESAHSRFPRAHRARDRGPRAYTFRSPSPGVTTQ